MTMVKSVRLSKKGQFVIPKDMRVALGVKEGDELLVMLENGRMILSRPHHYAKATRGLMRGAWGRTRRDLERYLDSERTSWR